MSEETKKPKTIEQRIKEYHPKFLEAIKDVYPLAVLGSLCIAISAFTSQNYTNAQGYAISAASMFLIAFVASLLFKAIKMDYFAFRLIGVIQNCSVCPIAFNVYERLKGMVWSERIQNFHKQTRF